MKFIDHQKHILSFGYGLRSDMDLENSPKRIPQGLGWVIAHTIGVNSWRGLF